MHWDLNTSHFFKIPGRRGYGVGGAYTCNRAGGEEEGKILGIGMCGRVLEGSDAMKVKE